MPDRRVARTSLSVKLLGRISVRTQTGAEIRLGGRHAQALLALLVLVDRPRTREAVAADLWPDTVVAATGPLRQALYQLRGSLLAARIAPETVFDSDTETIALRPGVIGRLDVADFEACTGDAAYSAEDAISQYAGDLAEGLAHECFAAERERLADRFEDALATVAATRLIAGDHEGARSAAERLLGRDPLREEAHSVIIAVHGEHGSRSQVVRQYRRLCAVLARELDERPLPETDATYRSALLRTVERSRLVAAAMEPASGPTLVAIGS